MSKAFVSTKPVDLMRIAQILFGLNAVVWLGFGIYTMARMSGRHPDGALAVWIIGLLMLGNAAAMLAAGLILGTRRSLAWLFGLVVLAINILLTFPDQIGVFDLITLLIDLALVGLLIATRRSFWSRVVL